jgi:hypothetical protein
MNKLKQFYAEAHKTLTAWLAAAIVFVAAVDNNIETLYVQVPLLQQYLPTSQHTSTILHGIMTVLGIGVAIARVRKILWPPKPPEVKP